MPLENHTGPKSQESVKPLNPDQRKNPGSYRSGRRDNRLPEEPKPRLPEATRAFIQCAFADGVVERIDRRKKSETPLQRKNWERDKWLLLRYVTEDNLSLAELRKFAGVTTGERARQLYFKTLFTIWSASPTKIKKNFSSLEVIRGKSRGILGRKLSSETREKMRVSSIGRQQSEETRVKIRAANKGRTHSLETRAKISLTLKQKLGSGS